MSTDDRDPTASADDFVAMAARLGLHGTDYVVGWTAWLDLAPVGPGKDWTTVGVHENVVEASWHALVDALTFGLARSTSAA